MGVVLLLSAEADVSDSDDVATADAVGVEAKAEGAEDGGGGGDDASVVAGCSLALAAASMVSAVTAISL